MPLKKTLFIVLISLLTSSIYAQKKIIFGVNTGINYTSTLDAELYNSEFSYLIGSSFEYPINNRFSLKLELNYERKKTSLDYNFALVNDPENFSSPSKSIFTNNQLTLPLLIKYKLNDINPFFINAGTFFSYTISSFFNDTKTNFNAFNFGFSLGIGKEIVLNKKNNLIVEIRNNLQLTEKTVINSSRLNTLSLTIGWNFTL